MANPFEDFIQLELPKRPWMAADVQEESVIVRRGAGPRQLQGVVLGEGQVLGMKDGVLQGVAAGAGGTGADAVSFVQETPATTWTITHNRNNVNVSVSVYDADGKAFTPDEIVVAANTVTITVLEASAGHVVLFFIPVPEEPAP
ncbi:hypothetical protein O152_gp092 [Pseudomonas phage PaBG]|uniref:Uncharacterized protein n=1 Tax=Pseudomonas phage PaBG TaxID=1335230 RepID=S5VV51_9CAUD|nr:hypothetical protein O152_gp092 [Pseudomonas phage PaBG]AGS81977.1 hypothetical protein PaBG_00092 [Pseudomonas phage PaBG]